MLHTLDRQVFAAARITANARARAGITTWPPADVEAARRLWPDLAAVRAALPHRTAVGIQSWCRRHFGICGQHSPRPWKPAELKRFRDMVETGATYAECAAALGRTHYSVASKAIRLRMELTSNRYVIPPSPTGIVWYDDLRARMVDLGMGRLLLARLLGLNPYTFSPSYVRRKGMTRRTIERAAAELEGTVTFAPDGAPTFAWDDE